MTWAALDDLYGQVAQLNPDQNPFTFVLNALAFSLFPHRGSLGFSIVLYVFLAGHTLALVLNIVTLYLRVRQKRFWLIRSSADFLTPNTPVLFSVLASIYAVFAIVGIMANIGFSQPGSSEADVLVWLLLTLAGINIVCQLEIWSCSTSLLSVDTNIFSECSARPFLSPRKFNAIVLLAPSLYLATTMATLAACSIYFHKAIDGDKVLLEMLNAKADSWSQGQNSVVGLLALEPQLVEISKVAANLAEWIRIATWTAVMILMLAIWLPLSILHYRNLRAQAQRLSQMAEAGRPAAIESVNPDSKASLGIQIVDNRRAELEALRILCRQRLQNACCMLMLGLSYIGLLVLPAIRGIDAIASPDLYRVFVAGCFSLFVFFGLPITFILLYQTWRSRPTPKRARVIMGSAFSHSRTPAHQRLPSDQTYPPMQSEKVKEDIAPWVDPSDSHEPRIHIVPYELHASVDLN